VAPSPPAPDDPALEEIVDLLAAAEFDLLMAYRLYEDAIVAGEAPLPIAPIRASAPSVSPPGSQVELALAA